MNRDSRLIIRLNKAFLIYVFVIAATFFVGVICHWLSL